MSIAVSVENLTKHFDKIKAVDGVDFNIKEGEIFGLLGPNGAGKTTIISILSTLLSPTSGKASVAGFDVIQSPAKVRNKIGIVFQDPSSDDILTGRENLYLHGLMYGVPSSDIKSRITESLDLVGLQDRADDLVRTYSGGMRRRLEIARGLMHHPDVLFLDEPTLGLDPQARQKIWEHIESIVKDNKVTIIITTHYMEEADRLCDRLAIIDYGKIITMDTPKNLKDGVGGDTVQLEVSDSDSLVDKINSLDFVSRCESRNNRLDVAVKDVAHNLPTLFSAVGEIKSFDVRNTTLNDVFLHYTGHDIREESAEKPSAHMLRVRNVNK
ncbi:MAG: ABC transporter ATP-binding protein [Marine Group III euryarchaeote CG-Bathy1]|uniref:ABC transporter ATP-binding protein n=1 Tax=Marine Group III euryarchaeote CG-Bathy1 TaxID=1889001 RepID=A0A1J5TPY2_9ARCH|nr:MAG: ABC transporter ATP-binding protein [Marine Group III euryarchaeote CG-Bathy1]